MTENEIKLIEMIRECNNPIKALAVTIQTILLFLMQP